MGSGGVSRAHRFDITITVITSKVHSSQKQSVVMLDLLIRARVSGRYTNRGDRWVEVEKVLLSLVSSTESKVLMETEFSLEMDVWHFF